MEGRASGVLHHITSLPSSFGIGDMGPWALKFADLLAEIKQSCWQILSLTPTDIEYGNSPYYTSSIFAGNPLLISPELLVRDDLLPDDVLNEKPDMPSERVIYSAVSNFKHSLLKKAYEDFKKKEYNCEFKAFCDENSHWLDDYALFRVLRAEMGRPWDLWPSHLKHRERRALEEKRSSLNEAVELENFIQFIFFRQWHSLKKHCEKIGLKIVGDLPFYVNHDSADVWTHPEKFKLDSTARPSFVGGVPPDYFSDTGQLWGNPVYDWGNMAEDEFDWYMTRIEHYLKLFDIVRIDHFRGYLAYWEIPVREKTAMNGRWVETPSEDFFKTLVRRFPHLPFIAEDLGVITPDVKAMMNRYNIPGMNVLVFAFSDSLDNPNLPHNYIRNSVVYTGTHDTNTARGWFVEEAGAKEKENLISYLGGELSEEEISWNLIKLAMSSISSLNITPLQDILSLGSEARMNQPSSGEKNWEWRVTEDKLASDAFKRFGEMTQTFGRH